MSLTVDKLLRQESADFNECVERVRLQTILGSGFLKAYIIVSLTFAKYVSHLATNDRQLHILFAVVKNNKSHPRIRAALE